MRHLKYMVAIMALVVIAAYPLQADVIGKTDEEVEAAAEPILREILGGFRANDYQRYSMDFDPALKETISEQRFFEIDRQIEVTLGECDSTEYLGFLKKGQQTLALWKARFSKSEDDVLVKLTVSKRGDRYYATGLWFE